MADHPRRPGTERPRVDDFFYDNPDPEPADDSAGTIEPARPAEADQGDVGRPARAADSTAGDEAASGGTASDKAPTEERERHTGRSGDADRADAGAGGDDSEADDSQDRDGSPVDADVEPDADADGPDADVDVEPDAGAEPDGEGGGAGDGDGEDNPGEDDDGEDDDGEDAREAARVTARRRAAAGRWARALALAGVAAALVYGAGSNRFGAVDLAAALDRSSSASTTEGQVAGLALVSDSAVGCVGPDLVGLEDPTVAEPDQTVTVAAGSAPVEVLGEVIDPADTGEILLTGTPDGGTQRSGVRSEVVHLQVSGADWVRGTATGTLAAGFAGAQLGLGLEEQQRGLSMASCAPAVDEAWFVAGGSEAGRAERLILANPTGNPVTVDVKVLGADGPVAVVGGRGIVVAPGARQVVLLDALAPGEERPVMHLTTTGGPVLAAVGDRWLEGTLDRGTELTTATAPPETTLVIPAVPGPRADSADTAVLRVGVPGDEQAVVQVRALTADGPARVAHGVTTVDAGTVADVDVSDLPEGTHALEVVADTPVVAAAQVVRRAQADGVGDLAWIPAVTSSAGLVGTPLPHQGTDSLVHELSLASVEGAVVEVVTVTEGITAVLPVEVPAAGNATVQLDAATESVWVRTVEGTAASALVTTMGDELGTLIAGTVLPGAPVTHQVRSVAPWLP